MYFTLVLRESAKDAALSMGLNVGAPVENLARSITTVMAEIAVNLRATLERYTLLLTENYHQVCACVLKFIHDKIIYSYLEFE